MRALAWKIVCLTAIATVVSPVAKAESSDQAVSLELVGQALAGKGTPELKVHVRAPVALLRLTLERSDGRVVDEKRVRPKKGVTSIALPQPTGRLHYNGSLAVTLGADSRSEPQTIPLDFDTVLNGPPQVRLADPSVDLVARTVGFTVDRDRPKVHLRVTTDDGQVAWDNEAVVDGAAGSTVRVPWQAPPQAVPLRLDLRVTDDDGYFQDIALFPWKIDIPHEDVLFDSGRSDIAPAQEPKLAEAQRSLVDALQKYGKFARVQLYVRGHTDSVGDAGSNRTLSEARARSIGLWFRQHKILVPISYAGAGEDALLVPTADGVDEPRNRRVEYTVSVEAPTGIAWKPVGK